MKLVKNNPALSLTLLFATLICLSWIWHVGFVRDDAYITFRYAENLANGLGFVYNPGEPVYGASSPGFTLLIAGWLLVSANPVIGAWALNVLSMLASLAFLWKILDTISATTAQKVVSALVLILSNKLLHHFLEGMETGMVIACMLASLYFMLNHRPVAAGLMAGAMLWLRIDSAAWIVCFGLVGLFYWKRQTIIFGAVAALAYLPWIVFAYLYFGSPVPMTLIAKRVAYGINPIPIPYRIDALLKSFTPFTILGYVTLLDLVTLAVIFVSMYGVWVYRRSVFVQVCFLFFVLQSAVIIFNNMTVEPRYMITCQFILLVLLGLGLYSLWRVVAVHLVKPRVYGVILALLYAYAAVWFSYPRFYHLREYQIYVYDYSLTLMGYWLNVNTEQSDVIFLEPLGYVGYHSNSVLLDEVGLLTKEVIPLKKAGLSPYEIAEELNPDYVIMHCDDAKRAVAEYGYVVLVVFDPLGFEEARPWSNVSVQRNACYVVITR